VAFAFTVVPGKAAVTGATMALVKSGQVMGQAPLTLDAAGADGVIRQIGRLPIDALDPGSYEIRVAVQAGSVAVNRSARVTVVP
jgi:hypothetical protein